MHVELRVTRKKVGWFFCLKLAWIFAAVAVLMIGFGTCLAGETSCLEAGLTMQGFMFVLSLPSSILFELCSPVIYGLDGIHSPTQYLVFWLGAFVVGLVHRPFGACSPYGALTQGSQKPRLGLNSVRCYAASPRCAVTTRYSRKPDAVSGCTVLLPLVGAKRTRLK